MRPKSVFAKHRQNLRKIKSLQKIKVLQYSASTFSLKFLNAVAARTGRTNSTGGHQRAIDLSVFHKYFCIKIAEIIFQVYTILTNMKEIQTKLLKLSRKQKSYLYGPVCIQSNCSKGPHLSLRAQMNNCNTN